MSTHESSQAEARLRPTRRFQNLAFALLVAYAVLAGLHHGEFWPFSRFPMFSNAGRPWQRSLVRQVSGPEARRPFAEVSEAELPGRPFRLSRYRINQDDLAQVTRTLEEPLSSGQIAFLADYFSEPRKTRHLVLYRVLGKSEKDGSLHLRYRPVAVISPNDVHSPTERIHVPKPKSKS